MKRYGVHRGGDGGGPIAAELSCGSCGAPANPTAKFCGECGARLAHTTHSAEYKQVTVLFAEVVMRLGVTSRDNPNRPPAATASHDGSSLDSYVLGFSNIASNADPVDSYAVPRVRWGCLCTGPGRGLPPALNGAGNRV